MKKLLIVLLAVCFCLFPVIARADNTNPYVFLEIYMYDTDPDDPDYGCVANDVPFCPEICFHAERPLVGELQCWSEKVRYNYAIVPIHVGHLDLPVIPCTPVPCGTDGGWAGVTYGVAASGVAVSYVGVNTCPGFNQGPGTAPGSTLFATYTVCRDWYEHPGYLKYMATVSNVGATYFDIVANPDEGGYFVLACENAIYDNTSIGSRAQWGGTKSIACGEGQTSVTETTWGKIKGLYR